MSTEFSDEQAPGAPGGPSNWCGGAKQAVGTSLGAARVWFTVGQGILNEVYYPRVDLPQIRDLGFIIADGTGFWQEVKQLDDCSVTLAEPGIPAVRVVHRQPRFTLVQRIVSAPDRDTILLEWQLTGDTGLQVYVLLAPHLGGTGRDNVAEVAQYRGRRVLWAEQGPFGLALAAVDAAQHAVLDVASAGYSGVSDGWQDFDRHGQMRWRYRRAGPGNVALTAALPRQGVLALGFGSSRESAATLALSSLSQPFDEAWQEQLRSWRSWHAACRLPAGFDDLPDDIRVQVRTSAMVLRTHCDRTFRGAMVASLGVPWGESAEERPGYHLVWPRDLAESAGALLALGADSEAREVLRYLIATQRADGSWFQNQWLGGKPYWSGIQLDEVAFPVLLAGTLADRDTLAGTEVEDMVRRALGFIVRTGPVSPQDRWEENSGINTFTMAVCIAALVSGARFLPAAQQAFALELADYWNTRLDDWTAVRDSALDRRFGLRGHYLRITPSAALLDDSVLARVAPIKNRSQDPGLSASEQIGGDFLQLVRYGLRDPQAPLVRDSVQLLDALLRVDLPQGPGWYRYSGDGYGEHPDGSPYDGTGQGRVWPLLVGERGHYELARGADALPYLQAMANMSDGAGMLPEQVWDAADVAQRRLRRGGPTGSAMPLAWAHAEFIKLTCSLLEKRPVDRPEPLWARYQEQPTVARVWFWSPQAPLRVIPAGARLVICLPDPGAVVWTLDDGESGTTPTRDTGLGVHIAQLPALSAATRVTFHLARGVQAPTYSVDIVALG
ncbi:MAG TPA: glycoside hydrolase family 15 protein [Gammaproteobacteria bacterium]|nr:glycoside hydrolase family 15 protein [Gammaproteobacteria bacterium]